MRKRSLAREYALQILYEIDITQQKKEEVLKDFWENQIGLEIDPSIKEFTDFLVKGVMENIKEIDKKISSYSQNWDLKRMAVVDRNILRLGSFEIIFCKDIPPKVSINEAVELAKRFSNQESAKFVNGILDKIKQGNPK
ncbi:MAG: transcription antitermination factor NusB [Candidatus Omnitrophica bacterium]|nr:transcription antitermination factor NusB [Candidatus Omnitrophota bacterium]MCM8799329.1 transcription antitermination factor NusB [Candidatus Omnitrophota bacterium]